MLNNQTIFKKRIFFLNILFFNLFSLTLQESLYQNSCNSITKNWYQKILKKYRCYEKIIFIPYQKYFDIHAILITIFIFDKIFAYLKLNCSQNFLLQFLKNHALLHKSHHNKTLSSILLIISASQYLLLIPNFTKLAQKYASPWLNETPYTIGKTTFNGPNLLKRIPIHKNFHHSHLSLFAQSDIYTMFKIFAISKVLEKKIN